MSAEGRPPRASGPGAAAVVAVDANGADLGPAEVAAGAALAAQQGARVLLFGPGGGARRAAGRRRDRRRAGLDRQGPRPGPRRAHDARGLDRAGRPRRRRRPRAGARLQRLDRRRAGRGQLHIRRAPGIHRPALALTLPVPGRPVTLLDVGANADVRPEILVQFAFMGAAYASAVLGVERPRVGLLSNGAEAERGSQLVLETHAGWPQRGARQRAFEFVGNVEGGDLIVGRRRRRRHRRLHRQRRAEADRGRLAGDARRDPRRPPTSSARGRAGGLLLRARAARVPRGDRPRAPGRRLPARAAPARRAAARPLHAPRHRARDRARRRGVEEDLVGATQRALEAAGALRRSPVSVQPASLRPAMSVRSPRRGARPDPRPPRRRARGRPRRDRRRRRASGRISRRTRSTSTRSCRSSTTPTASRSPTSRRRRS